MELNREPNFSNKFPESAAFRDIQDVTCLIRFKILPLI